jgi:hypothetical protein
LFLTECSNAESTDPNSRYGNRIPPAITTGQAGGRLTPNKGLVPQAASKAQGVLAIALLPRRPVPPSGGALINFNSPNASREIFLRG